MTQGERSGQLWLDSWAGRTSKRVAMIGETPKRYRVRLLDPVPLKGWAVGDVRLVPKYAVTFDPEEAAGTVNTVEKRSHAEADHD